MQEKRGEVVVDASGGGGGGGGFGLFLLFQSLLGSSQVSIGGEGGGGVKVQSNLTPREKEKEEAPKTSARGWGGEGEKMGSPGRKMGGRPHLHSFIPPSW